MDFLASGTAVLTASRLAQPVMDAPNAITVIDRATIEATGYHDISDLFRLVPGMYVGRMKGWFQNVSHTMADEYARRMQVLVDGRSVYLPTLGGVRWDALPLSVDDIERIEVARGPNAATFGANAFTGVINIITRHPEDVAGRMLRLAVGDHKHQEGWFRWGGGSEHASHRLTLGHREDGGFNGQFDDERSQLLNYRGEYVLDRRRTLGLQFGLMDGVRGEGAVGTVLDVRSAPNQPHFQDLRSHYLQLDYEFNLTPDHQLKASLSSDTMRIRDDVPVMAGVFINDGVIIPPGIHYRADLYSRRIHGEMQLNTVHGPGLRSAVGAYLRQDAVKSLHFWNTPDKLHADSNGVFGHVEWRLAPTWLMNAGAFWEDYEMVGAKVSPRVTLSWQPSPHHTLRAGVSHAYRNPVMFETNADWNLTLLMANGTPVASYGPYVRASNNVEPEQIVSRELSYLGMWPEKGLTADVRIFHETLRNFISAECPAGGNCGGLNPPDSRDFYNIGGSTQQGLEAQLKWRPTGRTQLLMNYALLRIDSDFDEKRYSPHHLIGLHLLHHFLGDIDLTVSQYWTSAFEPIGHGALPASKRLDVALAKGFRLGDARARIALGIENLGDQYFEFSHTPENLFDTRGYVTLKVDF